MTDSLTQLLGHSTPPTTTPSKTPTSNDEQQCLHLAHTFIELSIAQNFSHQIWHDHIAPNFRVQHDAQPPQHLHEAHDYHRKLKVFFPGMNVRIVRESVVLSKQTGIATVWQALGTTGAPEGVKRENLSTWQFRQDRRGVWLCYYYSTYRTCSELMA